MSSDTTVIQWVTRAVAMTVVCSVVIVRFVENTQPVTPLMTATTPIVAAGPALLRTVPVGTNPILLAIDSQAQHVFAIIRGPVQAGYVASGPGSVALLDTRTGTVLRRVRIGIDPVAVAIDARTRRVFVLTNGQLSLGGTGLPAGPTRVSILDAGTGAVVRTATLAELQGTAQALAVAMRANRVFVAGTNGVLTILDATTGAVLANENIQGRPTDIAVDEQTGRVFVANGGTYLGIADSSSTGYYPGSMSLLSATTGHVLDTLHLAAPVSALTIDEPARRVVVAEVPSFRGSAGIVELLDATTGEVRQTINVASINPHSDAGGGMAVAVDPRVHHAFLVTNPDAYEQQYGYSPTLTVLDTRTGQGVSSSYLPGSRLPASVYNGDLTVGLVMDEQRHHVVVALQARYPESTGDVLYGAPSGPGILAVYDARSGHLQRSVRLGSGALDIALDQRTNHVFVVNQGGGTVSVFDAARL